jgi:predicted O-methyltransferase YrrM
MTLDALGNRYGTDKASWHHNYLVRYEPYLQDVHSLLEIGVFRGASIRMWLDYLPKAQIHGIERDLSNYEPIIHDRFTLHAGDACDPKLWETLGTFDVIIDDGGHVSRDIKRAFDLGFSHLNPGGLWIVEDACAAYHPQYCIPGDPDTVGQFRSVLNELNTHGPEICGNPSPDARIKFVHFSKCLIFIGAT